MTSDGSAYVRFRRSLEIGKRATAAQPDRDQPRVANGLVLPRGAGRRPAATVSTAPAIPDARPGAAVTTSEALQARGLLRRLPDRASSSRLVGGVRPPLPRGNAKATPWSRMALLLAAHSATLGAEAKMRVA